MIAVFGATGKVGGKVAAMLLESGIPVRVMARSPEKAAPLKTGGAEVVIGLLQNGDDIKTTLDGCDSAFLMTPLNRASDNYIEEELAIGRNYGAALKDMDVGHVVYLSVINARDNTGIPFFDSKAEVEDSIARSGVDTTFLRPTYFMENMYQQVPIIQQFDMVSLPLPGDVPVPMVATEDVAYAAVQSLIRGGRGSEAYDLLAPKDYTMLEVTDIFSGIIGRKLRYSVATREQGEQMAIQSGMTSIAARDYMKMFDAILDGRIGGDRNRVYEEFNFDPTPLETVIGTMTGMLAV
ncbi:MAG: NmrA family NAD(P)-binding protein [Armatimonadota bacterium]